MHQNAASMQLLILLTYLCVVGVRLTSGSNSVEDQDNALNVMQAFLHNILSDSLTVRNDSILTAILTGINDGTIRRTLLQLIMETQ
jgi:hypothetical protein